MARRRTQAGTRRIAAVILVVALWGSRARTATAQGPATLDWQSPPECPAASAVLESLSELIDIEHARWDRFQGIRARVSRADRGWQLELTFVAPSSTRARRFEVRECAATADLAAVTLALALDPEGQGLGSDAPRPSLDSLAGGTGDANVDPTLPGLSPVPDPHEPSADAQGGTPSASIAPAAAVPIGIDLGLGGLLDPTGLGEPNFGATAWVTARRERLSLGVHGDWLPSARADVAAGGGVHLALAAAGVRGCYGPSVALGLCTELEAGALQASGEALEHARTARDLWLAPGASVEVTGALAGSIQIVSRVGVLVPLVRGEYLVNGGELAHRTPPIVMRLALGVALPIR
jgi:hypothetical protein